MTDPIPNPEELLSGTSEGAIAFLHVSVDRGDIPAPQGTNLRTGFKKVLEIAGEESVDLRAADLDDLIRRFNVKGKLKLKDESRQTYEKRFRTAVDWYLRFLDDDPTWKPSVTKRAKSTPSSTSARKAAPVASIPQTRPSSVQTITGARMTPFPVPLRPGVEAQLLLPADLTDREAKRIAKIVEALGGGEQPALPSGAANAS